MFAPPLFLVLLQYAILIDLSSKLIHLHIGAFLPRMRMKGYPASMDISTYSFMSETSHLWVFSFPLLLFRWKFLTI